MHRILSHNQRKEDGFTMVEMLAVIGIIGILTIIAIVSYLAQRQHAWSAAVKQDVSNAAIYIEQNKTYLGGYQTYYSQNANKPSPDSGIPGFISSEGTELISYSWGSTACIEGWHTASPDDTSYHYVIDDRKIEEGKCPAAPSI